MTCPKQSSKRLFSPLFYRGIWCQDLLLKHVQRELLTHGEAGLQFLNRNRAESVEVTLTGRGSEQTGIVIIYMNVIPLLLLCSMSIL